MPVTRKQQVLAKIETSEGVSANPGANDAILVFEPSLSDTVDVQDRAPAGPTLSRDFAPVGRQTRELQFQSDFRGSGDNTGATEPDWAPLLKACGYEKGTLREVTLGAVTGSGFQMGEIIEQSSGSIRAVVVGIESAAGDPVHLTTETGAKLLVVEVEGTLTAAATTGESSLSSSTASAVGDATMQVYKPTSSKLVRVAVASWAGGTPSVGDVLAVENGSGQRVGSVQVIVDEGTMTSMLVTLLHGSVSNTNTLAEPGGGTATVNANPEQVSTPSLTVRHNLDGRQRDLLGARGDFTLEGEVGSPMQFSWTFSGDIGPAVDAPPVSTSGLGTVRPPRLLGAVCAYGNGPDLMRLPTKSLSVANGGSVNPNLDANRAGGATGSNVTDRNPVLTFTVDQVHGGFDWEAARDAGTAVRVIALLGDTSGNVVGVVCPVGQVTEVALSDSDGIATFDVTVAARRVIESGDDELFFVAL